MASQGMCLRSIAYKLPSALRHSIYSTLQIRSFSQSHPLALKNPWTIQLPPIFNPRRENEENDDPADTASASASPTDTFKLALHQNKQWAQSTAEHKPDLFPTLACGQKPQILWIGCADSRIPETTVLGLQPGDVFVHRNIANIVPPGDLNSQSVIAYAVAHLKVKHIVVCGHTCCGGVNAALANQKLGLIDAWLTPLRKLRAQHAKQWKGLEEKERALKLVEANVKHGVQTLKENAEVIDAMAERGVVVHGLVYDVATGKLKELKIEEDEEVGNHRVEAFKTS